MTRTECLKSVPERQNPISRDTRGLDDAQIDEYEDITVAYLVLINDMYSSRDFSSDRASQNPVTAQILALHSINLLNGVNENDI